MTARLFLGGPLDGQVRDVEPSRVGAPIAVVEPIEDPFAAFRRADDPARSIPTAKRFYHYERLGLFGALLAVYVFEGMTPPERDARAREHLLSPLAKGFLK